MPARRSCTAPSGWDTGTYQSIYNGNNEFKVWYWQGELSNPFWHLPNPPRDSLSPLAFQPAALPWRLETALAAGEAVGGRTTHSPTALSPRWVAPPCSPRESSWWLSIWSGSEPVTGRGGTLSGWCLLSHPVLLNLSTSSAAKCLWTSVSAILIFLKYWNYWKDTCSSSKFSLKKKIKKR